MGFLKLYDENIYDCFVTSSGSIKINTEAESESTKKNRLW